MLGVLAMWLMLAVPLFFWPKCPCCGGDFCTACYDDESEWTITLSGLPLCDGHDINGTYILTRFARSSTLCAWRYEDFGGHPSKIDFTYEVTGGIYNLQIDVSPGNFVEYWINEGVNPPKPCDESLELELAGTDNSLCPSIWPPTQMVDPL